MNQMERIDLAEARRLSPESRSVVVGSTVRVHVRIVEGGKERVQVYEGVVVREQGTLNRKTFTVRRSSYGVWVERIFPLYSPFVVQIEVMRIAPVRRAKLYFLRQRTGRAARLAGAERATPAAISKASAAVGPQAETSSVAATEPAAASPAGE